MSKPVIGSIGRQRQAARGAIERDNREMTSSTRHLTGLCNLVNYFVLIREVHSSQNS